MVGTVQNRRDRPFRASKSPPRPQGTGTELRGRECPWRWVCTTARGAGCRCPLAAAFSGSHGKGRRRVWRGWVSRAAATGHRKASLEETKAGSFGDVVRPREGCSHGSETSQLSRETRVEEHSPSSSGAGRR